MYSYQKSTPTGALKKPDSRGIGGRIPDFGTWSLDPSGLLSITGTGELSHDIMGQIHRTMPSPHPEIRRIHIGAGITRIGDSAFKCSSVRYIVLPATLTHIGSAAFMMSDIEELVIPDSVIGIDEWAFESCRELKRVEMPKRFDHHLVYRKSDFFGRFGRFTSLRSFEAYHGIPRQIVIFRD